MTTDRPTARERFQRELATNPRCKEAPRTGQGFVILGARATIERKMVPKFGTFESMPARWTDYEAWVLFGGVWRNINVAEVLMNGTILDEEKYQKAFPQLPPMPSGAFRPRE